MHVRRGPATTPLAASFSFGFAKADSASFAATAALVRAELAMSPLGGIRAAKNLYSLSVLERCEQCRAG
jgi:hypothetical protein